MKRLFYYVYQENSIQKAQKGQHSEEHIYKTTRVSGSSVEINTGGLL